MFGFQLDEPGGGVFSTNTYSFGSGVGGSSSGGAFIAQAFDMSLVIGRTDSDEVGNCLQGNCKIECRNL